ncbi:unnamed protein product [Sphenostylis stenocarpa]|uniref:Uncharacterized protein n=1 Tax=Sphenostylis stenocarpa TaxID=92480 RepID=A0AA86S273_9FABA|nr:unnamed protein product [Sphenostylis stenocarpa]
MPPRKNNAQEEETSYSKDTRVEYVARELTKLKVVVDELVNQSLQNQMQMETMHLETTENQSKLFNVMSSLKKNNEEEEGEESIGPKKSRTKGLIDNGNFWVVGRKQKARGTETHIRAKACVGGNTTILRGFEDVFEEPKGLPPMRAKELINGRPYRGTVCGHLP